MCRASSGCFAQPRGWAQLGCGFRIVETMRPISGDHKALFAGQFCNLQPAPALDMPYSHQGNHFQSPYGSLFGPGVDSAGALGAEFARLALGKADSDDEDEDSEAERQQARSSAALAASGRTIETAPKPPPGALHPSMGSAFHDSGNCKRCCFYPRNRCLNGYECEFCHYEHEKRKRKNKKNKKKKAEAQPGEVAHLKPSLTNDLAWPNLPPMPIPPCHGPLPHPPHPPHAMHPACPPYMDAPLTYQWTDGMPGQTPAPPIIPGYEEYVAACCSRRLPGIEPPALATNPPPQAPYFDDRAPGYPFEPPQLPPYYGAPAPTAGAGAGALDPAAAPWVPPTSPYTPAQASNAKTQPSRDTEEGASSKLLGTSLSPPLEAAEVGQASMPQTSSGLPEKEASDTPLPLNLEPNMPPPDSSPKLNSDLVALQNPPPPDQSPTLPT
ncbi:Uncharacterized protein SCF082_LOCUS52327 [Durusdinium trenchii]|uniref:C3H1-type domain-containing protein n=1 Tax=Durusdinium trenchii TaxID=1381693 RepID=A0ABP0SL17_9DINO